ncbi:MFS transporter [Clostridium cellulovorans]|uniref:Major facilitator superfamily MFS_1 n=1 Tax=Clostridium cellulovorans (strain ATCC 35296 / DSM 3052 / OCM 3 / 743B) TaxID=573061 RepID=D9SSM9_CLOC7|nr:MFS transporter [Clostridium cellulovorans]ADL50626.1 major facilitator superfamily MFS_1 [Clostridium cellulovorans 743B]
MTNYKGNDRLLFGMILGVATYWLFASAITAGVPPLTNDLGISSSIVSTAVSITALICGVSIVTAGSIADRIGRVKMTQIGFVLSIIGSILCATAQGSIFLILGRVIQGLSGAFIMPSTLALINAYYKDEARPRALSFWSLASWGGSGVANFFGGAVVSALGWRWLFWLTVPVALLGMFLINGTPESKVTIGEKRRIDYFGIITLVLSLLSLNLVVTRGRQLGWTSPIILSLIVAFVILFSIFLIIERRNKAPLVDLSLFSSKGYNAAVISNFLLNMCAGCLFILMPYVQTTRGLSSFQSGLLTISYLVAIVSTIRVGEKVMLRTGARLPMAIGTLMAASGIFLMTLTFLPNVAYFTAVVVGLAIMGTGFGFYATPSTNTAVGNAPAEKAGSASGIYKMASSLGGSFGVAISGAVSTAIIMSDKTAQNLSAGWGLGVSVIAGTISLMAVLSLVPKKQQK